MSEPLPEPARCRGCGALIHWAKTQNNSSIAVDVDPSPDGRVTLKQSSRRLLAGVENGHNLAAARRNQTPLHTCHFDTCPKRSHR